MLLIRPATEADHRDIWFVLEPAIRAGETYTLPRDIGREQALAYWFEPGHSVYVADDNDQIVGTYFLKANHQGAGSHVANCGYVVSPGDGGRGVGRTMCEDSVRRAAAAGFRAMQFNFVVSSNERAVRLWQSCGFEIVGRLPHAFAHPALGFVDALVMYRTLDDVRARP
jgi:ribosomal protein S18 acetylase RimI-like enzyme